MTFVAWGNQNFLLSEDLYVSLGDKFVTNTIYNQNIICAEETEYGQHGWRDDYVHENMLNTATW